MTALSDDMRCASGVSGQKSCKPPTTIIQEHPILLKVCWKAKYCCGLFVHHFVLHDCTVQHGNCSITCVFLVCKSAILHANSGLSEIFEVDG